MMNPEVKAKWIAALRSGEYKQTSAALKNVNGCYCCLGVLCEVSEADTGFGIASNLNETDGEQTLGQTMRKWAGLTFRNGDHVSIDKHERLLSGHNDSGKTFAQIADAIEKQL